MELVPHPNGRKARKSREHFRNSDSGYRDFAWAGRRLMPEDQVENEKSPVILCQIDFRAAQVVSGCARLPPRLADSSLRLLCIESGKKYGSSSTKDHDSRRCPRRRRWRGNDFAGSEFELTSQPGDARPCDESDPAPWISPQRAGSAHFAAAFGNGLLSAEQSRLFASLSRADFAGCGILRERNEAACSFCRAALFTARRA